MANITSGIAIIGFLVLAVSLTILGIEMAKPFSSGKESKE